MFDYIIIGAGISGLYCAYKLKQKFPTSNIIILEKDTRLGGRINTKYLSSVDFNLELGAGRISDQHYRVLKLIKELGLDTKLTTFDNPKYYATMNSDQTSVREIHKTSSSDFYKIISELRSKLVDPNFYELAINLSFYRLVEYIYSTEKATIISMQHGYDDEFMEQNAVHTLNTFGTSFGGGLKYHGLQGGLKQIIDKLYVTLLEKGIKFGVGYCVKDITKHSEFMYSCAAKISNQDTMLNIPTKNIIFSIPKKNLLQIPFLQKINDKLELVHQCSLIRVYMLFPTNDTVWFSFLKGSLTTPTLLRQIIPINTSKGILMIYCDGNASRSLNTLHKSGHLKNILMKNLRQLFPDANIPSPNKIICSYYSNATNAWKAGIDPQKMYHEIIKPISDENIYLIGETFSIVQHWIEGSIQTTDTFIDMV